MATTTLADMRGKNESRAVAQMRPKDQIAHLLDQKKGEIAKMLPRHLTVERLLKVAQIAATTTPALAKCDIPSLVGAIGQCAQMGLEPNTVLGHAYLVPFNTKRKDVNGNERWVNSVQVIVGYKGLIDLARRSGQIISIAAHEVCENDKFELVYGLDEKLTHTPAMGERGEVVGFYAVAKLTGGGHAFEFMSRHQIEEIRDASQGYQQAVKYKKQATSPWGAHFVEMGRKTVIRRLAKFLPLSIEFQTAVAMDEMASSGRDQNMGTDTIDGEFMFMPDDAPLVEDGTVDMDTGEISDAAADKVSAQTPAHHESTAKTEPEYLDAGKVRAAIAAAKDADVLAIAADSIQDCPPEHQEALQGLYRKRLDELDNPFEPEQPPSATTTRTRRAAPDME